MSSKSFRGVRGILEAPRPLELISSDFVGPKDWSGKVYYISCVIDHATRFMFCGVSTNNKARDAIATLRAFCAIFGVPQAVLHDNGAEYTSAEFQLYVTGNLRAKTIRTSPYYPQGNGINESSHQALNAMISSQVLCARSQCFIEVVRRVTSVYNATPHGRLGASPYYAMFGCEMMFSGWQRLASHPTQVDRLANNEETRIESLVRCRLREFETLQNATEDRVVKPGDWVRFKLGDYERNSHFGSAATTTTVKFQPRWSWPAKVLEVKKGQAKVQLLGSPTHSTRLIALKMLRVMPTEIPSSIAGLNIQNIRIEAARIPLERQVIPNVYDVPLEAVMKTVREQALQAKDTMVPCIPPNVARIMCVDVTGC